MAGRRAPSRQPLVQAQTPKVGDPQTQRALDVVQQAILDLQARRHLEQFTAIEPGYVPESGGAEFDFLAADGTWKTVVGAGAVDSVTAGSSMISATPTTGNVVIDVVPSNFTGIPESGVTNLVTDLAGKAALVHTHAESDITGLVADLAARPTGSGTLNMLAKWTSGTALGSSGLTDDGTTVTFSGRKISNSVITSGVATAVSVTGAGFTASGSVLQFSSSATYNTTAGALSVTGVEGNLFGSKSAGANTFTQVAALFNAQGADKNIAIRTNAGDNYLNVTAGNNTGIGYGTGSTLPARLAVTATAAAFDVVMTTAASTATVNAALVTNNGTFDTTAGVLTSRGIRSTVTSTRSAGANNLTNIAALFNASGAQVNIALQTDSGSNYLNASGNNTGVGYASGATLPAKLAVTGGFDNVYTGSTQNASLTTWTAVAGTTTNLAGNRTTVNGTYDTPAAVLTVFGFRSSVTATRSAGANNLTNTAFFAAASGAQVNIGYENSTGDNYFHSTSGSTAIGVASGGTISAKLHVAGSFLCTGNATIGDGSGDTIKFYGGTGATQQTITGSRGGNAALADLLTKLATLGLIVDGTTA